MSGLEAAARIAKLPGNFRILIFTMHESDRIDNDVRAVGAPGYVPKSQAGRDLVAAIDSLLAGGTFFSGKGETKPSESGDKPIPWTFHVQGVMLQLEKGLSLELNLF